jgi:hypothetical protein
MVSIAIKREEHKLTDLGHTADSTLALNNEDTSKVYASPKTQKMAMPTPTFTRTRCRSFPSWTQKQERYAALIA